MSESDRLLKILRAVATEAPQHADELRELDAKIGDGDLGETIKLGCAALNEALPSLEGLPPSDQLARAGMAFNRAAASTFGVLFATALMRAGREVAGTERLSAEDVAVLGRAAVQAIIDRGKAKVGDKTLLDALVPAIDAYEAALKGGQTAEEATAAALEACEAAVRQTAEMQSRVSRASWLGERSVGVQDPGATAVLYLLRAASGAA